MVARCFRMAAVAIASAALFLGPGRADGAITYAVNTLKNGTVVPASPIPWYTATFAQNGLNTVKLTLASDLEVTSEFIRNVSFNVNPLISPAAVAVTYLSGPAVDAILKGAQNAQDPPGYGADYNGWDFDIRFKPGPPAARFNGVDVAEFSLSAVGLLESDFAFLNSPSGSSPKYAHVGSHLQGLPGGASGAVGDGGSQGPLVPEPASASLFAFGLASLAGLGRRRRKAQDA